MVHIVDGATPLIAGEAGREAIVPLENNTGWLDIVASKIVEAINSKFNRVTEDGYESGSDIVIPITLELYRCVYDIVLYSCAPCNLTIDSLDSDIGNCL